MFTRKTFKSGITLAKHIHQQDPNAFRNVAKEVTKQTPDKWGRFAAKAGVRVAVGGAVFGASQIIDGIEAITVFLVPLIPETELGGLGGAAAIAWKFGGFLDKRIDAWFDKRHEAKHPTHTTIEGEPVRVDRPQPPAPPQNSR